MNLKDYYHEVVSKLGFSTKRPYLEEVVIPTIDNKWNEKNVFIVEAPTGYGKTSISMTLALYSIKEEMKAIIALPQRSLLEDQYEKLKLLFNEDLLGKRYMHNPESPYLLKPITLTTIDTLSLTLLGISPEDLSKILRHQMGRGSSLGHYLFSAASIALSNIILDEAHLMTDSTKSLNFLVCLARFSIDCGRKLVLMSATIPKRVKKALMEGLRIWRERILFIEFTKEEQVKDRDKFDCVAGWDEKFVEVRAEKKYEPNIKQVFPENKHTFINEWLSKKFKENSQTKAIVIFNTVKDARDFHRSIKNFKWTDKIPKLLIHSRFTEADRVGREHKIESLKKEASYLIVTTQAIEVGVDISSNVMVTEIAPANSLIQRLGRFLRYDEKAGELLIWYESSENGLMKTSEEKYKVYDWNLTNATLNGLQTTLSFHIPYNYKEKIGYIHLLNEVYERFSIIPNPSEISSLYRITVDLKSMSKSAMEKFLELNGSFVRDEFIVPVIPKTILGGSLEKYQEKIIPISYRLFRKILRRDKVISAIIFREHEEQPQFKLINSNRFMTPLNCLREIVKNSISAFVVDAGYSIEDGLQVINE